MLAFLLNSFCFCSSACSPSATISSACFSAQQVIPLLFLHVMLLLLQFLLHFLLNSLSFCSFCLFFFCYQSFCFIFCSTAYVSALSADYVAVTTIYALFSAQQVIPLLFLLVMLLLLQFLLHFLLNSLCFCSYFFATADWSTLCNYLLFLCAVLLSCKLANLIQSLGKDFSSWKCPFCLQQLSRPNILKQQKTSQGAVKGGKRRANTFHNKSPTLPMGQFPSSPVQMQVYLQQSKEQDFLVIRTSEFWVGTDIGTWHKPEQLPIPFAARNGHPICKIFTIGHHCMLKIWVSTLICKAKYHCPLC